MGNRYFGPLNGLDEDAVQLWALAKVACDTVLDEIERALLVIHQDGPEERELHHWPEKPGWWWTHGAGRLFGHADRWGLEHRCGTPARVFDETPPLISLLAGDAEGCDTLIRDAATARRDNLDHPVNYEILRVTPEAPADVMDGLGVGIPQSKNRKTEDKVKAGKLLPREEARERAAIVRQRSYAYRAQSEALRHHCDLLLAIWDPDAEGKAGGTSESVEAALREQIPVIAVRVTGKEQAEIHLLENLRHLRALQRSGIDSPPEDWKTKLPGVMKYLLGFPDPESGTEVEGHHRPSTAYQPRTAFATFCANEPLRPFWPARLWKWFDAGSKLRALNAMSVGGMKADERTFIEDSRTNALKQLRAARRGLIEPGQPIPLPAAPPGSLMRRQISIPVMSVPGNVVPAVA